MFTLIYYYIRLYVHLIFFFQAEDGIRDTSVTGVQTCALPISATEPKLAKTPPFPEVVVAQPNPSPEIAPDIVSEDATRPENISEPSSDITSASVATELKQEVVVPVERFRNTLPGFIFSGVLLGLLPMWNSAVYIGAAAVLGLLFILFPLRLQMLALAIPAGLIALPQMLYLTGGSGRTPMPRLLHWGYTIDHPTAVNVAKYLGS